MAALALGDTRTLSVHHGLMGPHAHLDATGVPTPGGPGPHMLRLDNPWAEAPFEPVMMPAPGPSHGPPFAIPGAAEPPPVLQQADLPSGPAVPLAPLATGAKRASSPPPSPPPSKSGDATGPGGPEPSPTDKLAHYKAGSVPVSASPPRVSASYLFRTRGCCFPPPLPRARVCQGITPPDVGPRSLGLDWPPPDLEGYHPSLWMDEEPMMFLGVTTDCFNDQVGRAGATLSACSEHANAGPQNATPSLLDVDFQVRFR